VLGGDDGAVGGVGTVQGDGHTDVLSVHEALSESVPDPFAGFGKG
jgi:hypothetical protein